MRRALRDPRQRRLLIAGFLTFLAIGAMQAMYGPAFPGLRERFPVGLDQVSDTVTLHFVGSFVTIAASGLLLRVFRYRTVLVAGGIAFTAGAAIVAFGPTWGLVRTGALLGGLGFGLLDIGGNLLFARAFAPNAAPALNLLNAMFGLGAVVGPLLVGLFGATLQVPFALLALLGLTVTLLHGGAPEPERSPGGPRERVPWAAAAGFMAMYFVYVAAEVGVASWETTHLAPVLGASVAAYATSGYWGALTLGRVLASPISGRVRPADLVAFASLLGLAGLALAHWTPFAPYAYVLVGFAFAPIFPTGLAWLQRVFPRRSETVAPLVIAVANLGPVATSRPLGILVERGGPGLVPTLLMAMVGVLVLVTAGLWRATRRR